MAARRGKNQARRSGVGTRSGVGWLAIGLLLGGLVFGYLHFKDRPPLNSLLPKPDPNAQAPATAGDNALADVPGKPRTTYDFYKLLPEKEVVIPDAELDAQVRAEAAREAQQAAEAARAAADQTDTGGDTLALDNDVPAVAAVTTPAATTPATAIGTDPAKPAATEGPRYLIQAGAFRGSTEAEALKAQIALTGEMARVEVAQIKGITVHRVRMGPYPNAASLAAAKSALAAHGITAQAIRVK